MKKLQIFIFCLLQITTIWAQKKNDKLPKPMAMLRVEGVWQVFDTDGKLMWEPSGLRFQSPNGFSKGLFCVRQPKDIRNTEKDNIEITWGQVLVDVRGNWVWQPNADFPYRIIKPLDADSCTVVENLETGERSVFDGKGNQVTKAFADVTYLGKNCIIYADTNTLQEEIKTYIIENFAKKIILAKLKAKDIGDITEDMLPFTLPKNGKDGAGYFSLADAKVVIEPQYDLNKSEDNTPTPPQYQGNFIVLSKENQTFIFNKKGKSIFEKPMAEIQWLGKSFFKVRNLESEAAFLYQITENSAKKIDIKGYTEGVDDLGNMTNSGITYFIVKEKCGILNSEGKILKPLSNYKSALINKSYIILQTENEQFSVINAQGKTIRQFNANSLSPFVFGKSVIEWNNKKSVIRTDGSLIIKEIEAETIDLQDGFLETISKGKTGNSIFNFYNDNGKLVLANPMERLKGDWIMVIHDIGFYVPY